MAASKQGKQLATNESENNLRDSHLPSVKGIEDTRIIPIWATYRCFELIRS